MNSKKDSDSIKSFKVQKMLFKSFIILCTLPAAMAQLSLTVNADASYSIAHSGGAWLESSSTAPYMFAFNNALHTLKNGGLTLDAPPSPYNGNNFTGYTISFNNDLIEVSFQLYPSIDAIVFTQHFPKGLTSVAVNDGKSEDLSTSFPTFAYSKSDTRGYLVWPDTMCNGRSELWSKANSNVFSDGGTPLVLFNESSAVSVFSSFGDYMTTQVGLYAAVDGDLGAGFNGMMSELPPGYTHEVILVGGFGINNTVMSWGDLILGRTGKHRTRPNADLIVSTLGAWTDNVSVKLYESFCFGKKFIITNSYTLFCFHCTLLGRILLLQYRKWKEYATNHG